MLEVIKVTTSMNVAEKQRGHIVIEGTGLGEDFVQPYRLAIAWEWQGNTLHSVGNLLSNQHITETISIVDDNGLLAFLLPPANSEATVSYLSPRHSNVPNTGWTITTATDEEVTKFPVIGDVLLAQTYTTETPELMVGMPLPWSSTEIPKGFLPYTGIAFDVEVFPKLAKIYPNGILQDLQGDFIRAAEAGRLVLSHQGDTVRDSANGQFAIPRSYLNRDYSYAVGGGFTTAGTVGGSSTEATNAHGSRVIKYNPGPTSHEVRPVNTAFIFITKAG